MNEDQFLTLITQHQGIIHKICRLYRDTKEDREDLFQEIVYQLWKSVTSFKGGANFSTWMYKVALSTAILAFRKKEVRVVYTPEIPDRAEVDGEGEKTEQLFRVLRTLNDDEKVLITLFLEELSYKEIAEITGISEGNVGVRLNRVKQKIRKMYNIV